MNVYQQAYEKILRSQNILLLTHQRPDGDALSSVCALTLLLDRIPASTSRGTKKYTAFCWDAPPLTFNFLPNIKKMTQDATFLDPQQLNSFKLHEFDLIIVADCGSLDRTNVGKQIIENKKPYQTIIEFDHHPKVDTYSDIEIKQPEASSTTEILYRFFIENNLTITKNIANCILTGILTDTANFLHPTTTKNAINIASEMLLYGAAFPKITKHTWRNKDLASMKLWGLVLSNLEINPKYNIAFSVLTLEDVKKFGNDKEMYDGIAGFLSNINNIAAVMFLREEEKGKIKGSLRTSRSDVDVSKMANYLGGGGHSNASGFMIEGSIEKTEKGWKIL